MTKDQSEELKHLFAVIGSTTLSAGSIDLGLVFVLGAILAPVPSAGHAAELASVFIYGARSFEQRTEIINGAFYARFYRDLRAHKNDNTRRSIEFFEDAKNKIFESISKKKWIRNFAAHGTVSTADGVPKLIPGLYDYQTRKAMGRRKFPDGMTADEIVSESKLLKEDQENLVMLAHSLARFIQYGAVRPDLFLEEANKLADRLNIRKLNLQDPKKGPPLRQRRPKKKK